MDVTKEKHPMQSQAEIDYLRKSQKFREKMFWAHKDSKREGFELLHLEKEIGPVGRFGRILRMGKGKGLRGVMKLFWKFITIQHGMQKGINECFTDLEPYFKKFESDNSVSVTISDLLGSYPNRNLWIELEMYARGKWNLGNVGFTELPAQLIFKDKVVLFRFALVLIEEMKKAKIDQAPRLPAGYETLKVY
jgi:hypothetical protein